VSGGWWTGRGRARRTPAPPRADQQAVTAVTLGPASVHTSARQVRVGDGWAATLIVIGYPGELGMSWLEPLLAWPGRLDIACHIDPIPAPVAAARVRKQRARLESVRRIDAQRGRLDDPLVEAAADDAADLGDLIARGDCRLFEVGIYLTVHARTRDELAEAVAEVRAVAASILLDTHPATWRQRQGWTATLPLGHDGLRTRRVMDTAALAASFPLGCPDLPGPLPGEPEPTGGVLYGLNPDSGSTLVWDRWTCDNHNSVVLAHSGAGKSYLMKLEVLRNLYDGAQVAVVDPEDEYVALARAVGGSIIQLGAPGVHLNPFDVPPGDTRHDALTRRAQFLHTLVAVLLGQQPPPAERAALDRAITDTYTAAGITPDDPRSWGRPAPLLRDLAATLTRHGHPNPPSASDSPAAADAGAADPAAATLAARLAPWVQGSMRALFEGPSTVSPHRHLVVWSTRHLPSELRAPGMLLALDAIWRDIDTSPDIAHHHGWSHHDPRWDTPGPAAATPWDADLPHVRPTEATGTPPGPRGKTARATPRGVPRRLVVVDEAWSLMREPEGARFLALMAKSSRKRRAGLAVVTQDAVDLLASDLGQVVVANAATQILMRQAPQAIHDITTTFALSAGEAQRLLSAQRGEALLLSGSHRLTFQTIASRAEHLLAAGWADLPTPAPDVDDRPGPSEDAVTHDDGPWT
jgi:hypothetical protein